MKLRNLAFMPFVVVLDVVTLGAFQVTESIKKSDYDELQLEALKILRKMKQGEHHD